MSPRFRDAGRWAWPALAVLAVGLALTGGLGWELHREAHEIDRQRFDVRVEEFADQIDGRIERTELLLRQFQDYLMLSGDLRWRVLGEWMERRGPAYNFPWVHGFLIATNRHVQDWVAAFPRPPVEWSNDDWSRFQAMARTQVVECVPAVAFRVNRDRRFLTGTNDGRQFLADYNLRGLWRDGDMMARSAGSARTRMSGRRPVMLDGEAKELIGALLYAPVHEAEVTEIFPKYPWNHSRRRLARWRHLDSMIVAPIDFRMLLFSVWNGAEADLGVELFSSTNQVAATWLDVAGDRPRAEDPGFKPGLSKRVRWRMFGDVFSMFIYTTPLFEAQSPKRLARTVMAAGAGVTVLAAVLVAVIGRARRRQQRMAAAVLEARDALAAAEKERVRLGHDLHDGAIQSLYGIQLGLSRTAGAVENTLPSAARVLEETRARVDEVIVELRRFILARETETESGPAVSLDTVLASMVDRMRPTTSARLEFESEPGAAARLSVRQAVQLTQLARSALANSLRHSGARRIGVKLREADGKLRLEIEDDGAGFDPGPMLNHGTVNGNGNGTLSSGTGLRSMRQRVEELGGTLAIDSVPGRGTRLVAEIPIVTT